MWHSDPKWQFDQVVLAKLKSYGLVPGDPLGIHTIPLTTLTPMETPMFAPPIPTQRYTGKVVLVERINPAPEHDASYDGQYLVYAETPSQLFAQQIGGRGNTGLSVYGLGGGFRSDGLPLAGEAAYRVVAVDDPEPWMLDALDQVDQNVADVREGRVKAAWVSYVYDNAEQRARLLRKVLTAALGDRQDDTEPQCADSGPADKAVASEPVIRVTVPRGFRALVSYE